MITLENETEGHCAEFPLGVTSVHSPHSQNSDLMGHIGKKELHFTELGVGQPEAIHTIGKQEASICRLDSSGSERIISLPSRRFCKDGIHQDFK